MYVLEITGLIENVTKKIQAEVKAVPRLVNEDGRYEVLFSWKNNHFPDSREVTEKRLRAVTKKLQQDNLYEDYNIFVKLGFQKVSSRKYLNFIYEYCFLLKNL